MAKEDTKNQDDVKLVESQTFEAPQHMPSTEEQAVISAVFDKFRITADDRNRHFEYFDGQSLIEYLNDSVRRFITNIDVREDIEDWQSIVHNQFTRTKVLAILSKVVKVLPIAEFSARGDEDTRRAQILNSLYEYAEDIDDYEELMLFVLLEAIVKGTAIGYEGVEKKTKNYRDVKGFGDDITITETKEVTTNLFGGIVPLEEFYPSSVSIRNIKSMPFCFWVKEMSYTKFKMDWDMFERSKFVVGKGTTQPERAEQPFYVDHISGQIQEGNVELIRYYNEETDEYVVMANGVWLNPIMIDGKEVISPLPFNHKKLPFWDIKFDFFGSDFFYGKSLPDRLKTLQDVINVLNNMLLDQSFLTVFKPILTNGIDSIEDDFLRPGRRIPVDTQGLSLRDAYMPLDLGTPSGWHQYILEYTKRTMEEASLDQVSSGQAGVGGRTTAEEIRTAAEGVASILGLFGRMINYGVKRKALLKGSNILQFWTDPNSPRVLKILGEGSAEEMSKVFNTFRINNVVLTNGKRGTQVIEMYKDTKDFPTKSALKARQILAELESGKNIQIDAITPEHIRDMQTDIKLVTNPRSEATKEIEMALQLEKVRVYATFFPEQVDFNELAAQTALKMGDDPTQILRPEITQPEKQENAEGTPEDAKKLSENPQDNTANNIVRSAGGAAGGERGAGELAQLSSSMTG